jgi:hypothetical protein
MRGDAVDSTPPTTTWPGSGDRCAGAGDAAEEAVPSSRRRRSLLPPCTGDVDGAPVGDVIVGDATDRRTRLGDSVLDRLDQRAGDATAGLRDRDRGFDWSTTVGVNDIGSGDRARRESDAGRAAATDSALTSNDGGAADADGSTGSTG